MNRTLLYPKILYSCFIGSNKPCTRLSYIQTETLIQRDLGVVRWPWVRRSRLAGVWSTFTSTRASFQSEFLFQDIPYVREIHAVYLWAYIMQALTLKHHSRPELRFILCVFTFFLRYCTRIFKCSWRTFFTCSAYSTHKVYKKKSLLHFFAREN